MDERYWIECEDKNGRRIRPGDFVRVTTIASINGVCPVVRGDGEDGELYLVEIMWCMGSRKPYITKEHVRGFPRAALEVVNETIDTMRLLPSLPPNKESKK